MNKLFCTLFVSVLLIACNKQDSNKIIADVYVSGYETRPVDYPNYLFIHKYWVDHTPYTLNNSSSKFDYSTGIFVK